MSGNNYKYMGIAGAGFAPTLMGKCDVGCWEKNYLFG